MTDKEVEQCLLALILMYYTSLFIKQGMRAVEATREAQEVVKLLGIT